MASETSAPLRGADVSDAIIEILAITRWGELDYLIIDMPPGLGDATLDMIRLIDGIRFLVVTTPSRVAYETVRKLLTLLRRLNVPVVGVVENIVMKPSDYIKKQANEDDTAYLGAVDFDTELEEALGDVDRLSATMFYRSIQRLLHDIKGS